eukprot:COSAG01_NODE_3248_length_6356_cov_12.014224_2_plen_74_part_00
MKVGFSNHISSRMPAGGYKKQRAEALFTHYLSQIREKMGSCRTSTSELARYDRSSVDAWLLSRCVPCNRAARA